MRYILTSVLAMRRDGHGWRRSLPMGPLSLFQLSILRHLSQQEVRYLVIGGFAVRFYFRHRETRDLDIWVDPVALRSPGFYSAIVDASLPFGCPTPHEDFA